MFSEKRIYLAAPYYDNFPEIRQHRYDLITKITAKLMKSGYIIFSPITHSHYLAEYYDCPNEPMFWSRWYLSFLKHWATNLWVVKLYGWECSKGVLKEIRYAKKYGLHIRYFEVEELL